MHTRISGPDSPAGTDNANWIPAAAGMATRFTHGERAHPGSASGDLVATTVAIPVHDRMLDANPSTTPATTGSRLEEIGLVMTLQVLDARRATALRP